MRIHGICLVKNEADIMPHFLHENAQWCDRIYVFDNGSTDGTWALTQQLARTMSQIVPFRQNGKPFDDAMRAEVFNYFRGDARENDWWCRLDADELYIDDPRTFLKRVPEQFHVVWSAHLQYFFTAEDLPRFDKAGMAVAPEMDDTTLPRHYSANASEARFFRHRPKLRWPDGAWPRHLGLIAPERIRVKHFQYRSPAQIQRRLDTRREASANGWPHFQHSLEERWQDKIADSAALSLDRDDGRYEVNESLLPRHLEPHWQRAIKYVMHGSGIWP